MQFASFRTEDGTEVLFETTDTSFVEQHGGVAEAAIEAVEGLTPIAKAVAAAGKSLRSQLSPDEFAMEVGIGLSAEVGWFVAKSQVEASIKLSLVWNTPAAK
ncbi:CU044_2847 family protein [Agrococcus sp. Ld7]|uniref:CU044_2847 family protein n=1 Tax=Agrococcus sp. Ld7 TaxID=649148 RepID=UPI0038642928